MKQLESLFEFVKIGRGQEEEEEIISTNVVNLVYSNFEGGILLAADVAKSFIFNIKHENDYTFEKKFHME